jgi:signal transduction histidine kinase
VEAVDAVSESSIRLGPASVSDEFRRLAELLHLAAVGVVTTSQGKRRVTWWAAPDCPPLPSRLSEVLESRAPDWLVLPLGDEAYVFARLTEASSVRSRDVLGAVGASLVDAFGGTEGEAAGPAPTERAAGTPPGSQVGDLDPQLDIPDSHGGRLALPGTGERMQSALAELAMRGAFECAALFMPRAAGGWRGIERFGPGRPWEAVLDPDVLGAEGAPVFHPDVQAVPGLGPRLSALGCRAVAMLPVAPGGRLILSTGRATQAMGWLDEAGPFVAAVNALIDEVSVFDGEDRWRDEAALVERAVGATRRVLERATQDAGDLLRAVRDAIQAHELFSLVERGGALDVLAASEDEWPRSVPAEVRHTVLGLAPDEPIDRATVQQIGAVLGCRSAHLLAACTDDGRAMELVVVGWREPVWLSQSAMGLLCRLVGAGRVAIESRGQAVSAQVFRERTKWAYQIHDGLIQTVTTAVLELETLKRRIELDPGEATRVLADTKTEIRKALGELRGMLLDLSSEESYTPQGEEPLTTYVEDVVRRWRLPAEVSVTGQVSRMPRPLQAVAYLVVREALANAAKHAAAPRVRIRIDASNEALVVEVEDTGQGFDPELGHRPEGHFGLQIMRKRVEEVSGTLEILSSPGKGTRIAARLPIGTRGDEQ